MDDKKGSITLIIAVLGVIAITYFATAFFLTGEIGNKEDKKEETNQVEETEEVTEIFSNMIIASKTFTQKESKYMVLFFSKKDLTYDFKQIVNNYSKDTKLYKVNVDEAINSFVVSKEENINVQSYRDLKVKAPTLITIENRKNISYISGNDKVIDIIK